MRPTPRIVTFRQTLEIVQDSALVCGVMLGNIGKGVPMLDADRTAAIKHAARIGYVYSEVMR